MTDGFVSLFPGRPMMRGEHGSQFNVFSLLLRHILLMIREGEVGMVGMTDEAVMGYYVVKWLSESYSLQVDTDGMSE
jgi:hypothetical protein